MNLRSRNRAVVLLLLFWTWTAGAQAPVNPTVKVLPRPTATVPAECDVALAPAVEPRIQPADVLPPPRDPAQDLVPPPSRDLRAQLLEAQEAAERNDRTRFQAALADVKATVAGYPPGGEKNAANEVLAVYNDLDRLWDYQFSSPVGAFFDETVQGGGLLAAVRKYPGYDDFIRRHIITDASGSRFYPTSESREFLNRVAAERLSRVGGITPTPRTRTGGTTPTTGSVATTTPARREPAPSSPRVTTQPQPQPQPQPRTAAAKRSTTPRGSTARSTTRPRPQPEVSEGTPTETPSAPVRSASAQRPSAAPRQPAATTATAAPPSGTQTTTLPATQPQPVRTATTAPVPTATEAAPPPLTSLETAFGTDTTGTTATDTSGAPPPRASRTRSVILPIILILIGVGVLIVLFRASS